MRFIHYKQAQASEKHRAGSRLKFRVGELLWRNEQHVHFIALD